MSRSTLRHVLRTAVASAALAIAAAVPGAGQEAAAPEKQAPPPAAAPRDFTLPAAQNFTLANGMKVTLVPYGTVPKVTVQLSIWGGSSAEAANQVWLSDLVTRWLREGTTSRSATGIASEAARMGGTLDTGAAINVSRVVGTALSEFAPDMVELVADVAQHPKFPESELQRLKTDMARDLSVAKARPQQIALEKFRSVLYPEQPYGRLFPTPEMIGSFTAADAKAFYDANTGAARAHLYVAGVFDASAVEKAVRQSFDAWNKGTAVSFPKAAPKSTRAVYLLDRPDAVQSTVILGMPAIDPSQPDYVPLLVTHTLLGGYFSSRITANIREQKGYTYSPGSQLSVRYRDGYWAETADVTTNVTGPSLKEIFYEIDRLQGEAPGADELKAVQNYMSGVFVLQNSTRGGIIGQLEFVDLHGLPADYLASYVRKLNAVTPAQVQGMAQKYLQDDRATIVVVGDRKVIEEQVKTYGPLAP